MADNVIGFAFGVDTRIARFPEMRIHHNVQIDQLQLVPLLDACWFTIVGPIRLSSWLLAIQSIDSLISS